MSGRYWGKRFYGLYVGARTEKEKETLVKQAKRHWVSVKVVPTRDGGYNLYVWGHKKKRK